MTTGHRRLETAALLALVRAPGARWQRIAEAVEDAGSALAILDSGVPDPQATLFADGAPVKADLTAFTNQLDAWEREGIRVATVLDADYPENLRTIYNRPPLVFIAGDLVPNDARSVAIVGTRQASPAGRARARRAAVAVVEAGMTVVSGLAAGIDTAAHTAALEAGGRTVAVIGTGLHRSYPAENAELQARIAHEGAVLSQFLPDAPPTKQSFPMRNAVMSGLALATVVIEAPAKSGARIQARCALEHGRRLFLPSSMLEHDWAREFAERPGAHVVDDASEIVEILQRVVEPTQLFA